eukprot:9335561-Alexandrium_andersonii.AAC.1
MCARSEATDTAECLRLGRFRRPRSPDIDERIQKAALTPRQTLHRCAYKSRVIGKFQGCAFHRNAGLRRMTFSRGCGAL